MTMTQFILIVMFASSQIGAGGSHPFVAMQSFATVEACQKALTFLRAHNTQVRAECIKDEAKPG